MPIALPERSFHCWQPLIWRPKEEYLMKQSCGFSNGKYAQFSILSSRMESSEKHLIPETFTAYNMYKTLAVKANRSLASISRWEKRRCEQPFSASCVNIENIGVKVKKGMVCHYSKAPSVFSCCMSFGNNAIKLQNEFWLKKFFMYCKFYPVFL